MCASRGFLRLTREWWLAKMCHTCGACRKLKGQNSWITTRQKVQFSYYVIWRLELVTHLSRELLTNAPYFAKKWFFTFLFIPYYKYPLYPRNVENFQREFWEINPREQQYWFIHNLIPLILQIFLLSASPLSYPWEDLKPNPCLTTFRTVRRLLEFGK